MSSPGSAPRPGRLWLPGLLVLLAFGVFLWSIQTALSPVVALLTLLALLHPFRHEAWAAVVAATGCALGLLWVIGATGFLLAPFVVALGVAYILDPLVDRLARRMPRWAAILLLGLPVLGLVVLLLAYGIPALWNQGMDLLGRLPSLLERVAAWLEGLPRRIGLVELPGVDGAALAERVRAVDTEMVMEMLADRRTEILDRLWSGALGVGRGVATVATVVGYVVLTPVLLFYLLRDWDRLLAGVMGLVPSRHRAPVESFGRDLDRKLAGYLRGQLTVAAICGGLTAVGLWVLDFPYALLLGALAGGLGMIPYVGLVVSLLPAVIIALLTPSPLLGILKVAGVFGAVSMLEGSVLAPRIVGDSTNLHPVVVVLALTLGGFFFGFPGLLLGVPAAAAVKLLLERGMARYRQSSFFRRPSGATVPEGIPHSPFPAPPRSEPVGRGPERRYPFDLWSGLRRPVTILDVPAPAPST